MVGKKFKLTFITKMKKFFNAAIIGLGRIGSLLENDPLRFKPCTHAGAMINNPKIRLIAGCDTNPDRLIDFQNMWKVEKIYTNYKQMISECRIDILSIASPSHLHVDMAQFALDYKIPVILLEKPVGVNLKEARKLLKKYKKSSSLILINHERRFCEEYRAAKDLISNNQIGEIRQIIGQIMTGASKKNNYSKTNSGPLLHDGTHLIDIIRFLLNCDFKEAYSIIDNNFKKNGIESSITGILKSDKNIPCIITAGGQHNFFHFSVDIQGSNGRIIIGNGFNKIYYKEESKLYKGFYDLCEKPFPELKNTNMFNNLTNDIIDYFTTGKIPSSTLEDGVKAMETIFALYQAGITKKRVKIPIKTKKHPFLKS
jgi:predicted dehydrogenase